MTQKEMVLLSFCFQWRAGRELAKLYEKETGKRIGYGTLYCCMRNLKEEGLVQTRDGSDEDGPVRYFKITEGGSRRLREEKEKEHSREAATRHRPGFA